MQSLRHIVMPVITAVESGQKRLEVSELWGASRALFLFGMHWSSRRPLLVLTASEDSAEALIEDLRFFGEQKAFFTEETPSASPEGPHQENTNTFLFPSWAVLPFEADSPDSRTVGERMRFLYHLISGTPGIYVVPIAALMQKLPPWGLFADSVKTITMTTPIDPDTLSAALLSTGYESASLVTRVGEFSRRGGIIDFFSPLHENPVRVEFFGDALESLREFDAETQRSLAEIKEAVLLPVRELIINGQGRERFEKRFHATDDKQRPSEENIRTQIEEGILPPGGEFLAPFFYDMESLFRYVPQDSLVALIEPDDINKAIEERMAKIETGRAEELGEGRVLPDITELYLRREDVDEELSKFTAIALTLLGTGAGYRMDTKSSAWLSVRLTRPINASQREQDASPAEGTMTGVVEKLRRLREFGRVALVCGTQEAGERVKKLFMEHGLGVTLGPLTPGQDKGPWPIMATIGRLTEGFSWQELGVTFIAEEEIFGRKVHPGRSGIKPSKVTPFLSTFKELKPGDFVVHTDYGVGEYQGLTHISVDGFETDFLTLRYEPDAKLHVPLYSLDKVQKYIGAEGLTPKLNRLGAPTWAKTREKVRKDILEMAQQLVAVYAAREAQNRPSFSAPDNLYREFEAAFPYEETDDQQKAIEDVLGDMQRPRPMDRVVCGDVGYGKTEVALRAAFKAVEDGKQAAVLVPTTLLADQHYRTFRARLESFSIRVDVLSRFRTRSEQQDTLRGLKNGTVDIVIGTHRLLQKDVAFKNLGLLVVDEEQRFGVTHKERIKQLRASVDALALTATPIPRTLQMAVSGLRDMSLITTPPADRRAIRTISSRFDEHLIAD
ncbi:MAG TPA: DEAD/DEAH box helicase, partial [Nitrospirota bacterium]